MKPNEGDPSGRVLISMVFLYRAECTRPHLITPCSILRASKHVSHHSEATTNFFLGDIIKHSNHGISTKSG